MLRKSLLFLTLCFVSLGAAQSQISTNIGADGYYLEKAEVHRTHFNFVLHPVKDRAELIEAFNKVYAPSDSNSGLKGFYVWDEKNNTCHVYIVDPITQYEPEYLGHEVIHCLFGDFHNQQTNDQIKRERDWRKAQPIN